MNYNSANIELLCPKCANHQTTTRYDIKLIQQLGPLLCPKCGNEGMLKLKPGSIDRMMHDAKATPKKVVLEALLAVT